MSLERTALESLRSFTTMKMLGDGSFASVWLCDWHSMLPPGTPLPQMQVGAGARPEWAGKRLVAIKRMKSPYFDGWEACRGLSELRALRQIPSHPNIIALYDCFLDPISSLLHLVFESLEGNLYQLIKARRGRPLAGGLIASIFSQIVFGLHHIHESGYFHRDMKPENILLTTTGLHNYPRSGTDELTPAGSQTVVDRDVAAIVKICDFGLARETASEGPLTEYVSVRWYRAPEVILRTLNYSSPVDMWALGAIMAELLTLRPLFPGRSEIDQLALMCETLGDPSPGYVDGGGEWSAGVRAAQNQGFEFPKVVSYL